MHLRNSIIEFVFADVNFVATGIKQRKNPALGMRCPRERFEQRDRDDRLFQDFSQSFNSRQSNAKSGERPWTRGNYECVNLIFGKLVAGKQSGDLRNKLGGESSSTQREHFNQFKLAAIAVGNRNATVLA